ncbi:cytidylyltransferase domain-containing protein [Caloranaerobacter azorensis]|uniref:Acylneuraminate cytidylyltransferase n=1 Tax=Caloranaerobacter azorensis TaxID=116090 RepID=A0A6P1YFI4_9FIRM|nr:glycosyltransferase family protein [Caloranaerobacter azorensis]QIB27498.1 acylneuraminate cytidylyltransferase [Caloranaerobacter azorensis]
MRKVVAIIQARMGSTRLPGKVMKDLFGKTVLAHVVERVKRSKEVDEIVIATTTLEKDNVIVKEAEKCGVKYFRGSEDDVLGRYYYTAKDNNADIVVRITSDCPLIDPIIIDSIVKFYKENDYDIVTNAGIDLSQRTFPRGLDTEVFSFKILEKIFNNAKENYQREHVTPYIYENSNKIYYYKNDVNYSDHRWTLDTEEDFKLIKEIYRYLYKGEHNFYMEDILKLFKEKPELKKINIHIEQKKVK